MGNKNSQVAEDKMKPILIDEFRGKRWYSIGNFWSAEVGTFSVRYYFWDGIEYDIHSGCKSFNEVCYSKVPKEIRDIRFH